MLNILYEDHAVLVVKKPAGMESQSSRGFEPDMVSEIKKHIRSLYTDKKEPYVGVIHRLDKPVSGVMVYAKTQKAAASLSKQVQDGRMIKIYRAVLCGKPVDNVGNYVDYLRKDGKTNVTAIVDMGITGAKRAELNYRVIKTIQDGEQVLTLVEIELLTGRHHQIRVQFAGHGLPLWGDQKYNPEFNSGSIGRKNVALSAYRLTFRHPEHGKVMEFTMEPEGEIFKLFR